MSAGCALTPADRYSTKMASEGASGEQPPPVQTLATAVLGSVDTVRHEGFKSTLTLHGCVFFYPGGVEGGLGEKRGNAVRIYSPHRLVKQQRWPAGASRQCLEKNKRLVFGVRLINESEMPSNRLITVFLTHAHYGEFFCSPPPAAPSVHPAAVMLSCASSRRNCRWLHRL